MQLTATSGTGWAGNGGRKGACFEQQKCGDLKGIQRHKKSGRGCGTRGWQKSVRGFSGDKGKKGREKRLRSDLKKGVTKRHDQTGRRKKRRTGTSACEKCRWGGEKRPKRVWAKKKVGSKGRKAKKNCNSGSTRNGPPHSHGTDASLRQQNDRSVKIPGKKNPVRAPLNDQLTKKKEGVKTQNNNRRKEKKKKRDTKRRGQP